MSDLLKEFEKTLARMGHSKNDDPFLEQSLRRYAFRIGHSFLKKAFGDYSYFVHQFIDGKTYRRITALIERKVKPAKEGAEDNTDAKEILRDVKRGSRCPGRFRDCLQTLHTYYPETYNQAIEIILKEIKPKKIKGHKGDYIHQLASIQQAFRLSDKEADIVTFFYIMETNDSAESFFKSDLHMHEIVKSIKNYCRLFDVSAHDLKNMMSNKSPLLRAGLLKKNRQQQICLSESVGEFLSGASELDLISIFVKKAETQDALEASEHNIKQDHIQNTLRLAQATSGSNILLYGRPGTGKTEFVKTIGKTLNKDVYFVTQKDEDGDENLDHRKSAIVAAQNILSPDSIIVIDECDQIVNAKAAFWECDDKANDKKAWINDLLESTKHTLIWISNRVDGIDDSTKRRFSYSLEFSDLGQKQRLKVWQKQADLHKADFLTKADLDTLSRTFKVNAGGISLALRDIQAIPELKNDQEKVETLKKVLSQHQHFVFGTNTKLATLSSTYDLDVINADIKLPQLLSTGEQFLRHLRETSMPEVQNLNLLLQGPPGTGKTEFVKYLSEHLGVELMIKRLSDIRSAWYGESLKNIAGMFAEAQSKESILFLDEADTFFSDRQASHEHYKAETNELLTQMENFKGILVCATNFAGSMDQAVMRRFTHKIKFDYLQEQAKIRLFQNMLLPLCDSALNPELEQRIASLPALTPGDFKVVRQKNFFNSNLDPVALVEQLETEIGYKKHVAKPVRLI